MQLNRFIRNLVQDEDGVTAIEYGLIAALIAVVIVAAVQTVGTGLLATFTEVADNLPTPVAPPAE